MAQQVQDPAAHAKAIQDAGSQLAQNLAVQPNAIPAELVPPAPPTAAIPNAAAQQIGAFAAPQTLYSQGTPGVSGDTRTALLMSAGDNAVKAMLALLGDPGKISGFSGKRVLFGVSMVSFSPGWKTRTGYSADLQGTIVYKWDLARPVIRDAFLTLKSDQPVEVAALRELQSCVMRGLTAPLPDRSEILNPCAIAEPYDRTQFAPYVYRKNPNSSQPIVAGISPMGDAQAMDLQSSARSVRLRALQMAFSLASAGMQGQAEAFMSFAKQQQRDLETRTSNIVVSAYGAASGTFGFKAFPRLAAEPDVSRASALDVPTFPALLIVGADDEQLRPRVLVKASPSGLPTCTVLEPQLTVSYNTQWLPLSEPCHGWLPGSGSACQGDIITQEEIYGLIAEQNMLEPPSDFDRFWAQLLRNRFFGQSDSVYFPSDVINPPSVVKPTATAIAPIYVELQRTAGGFVSKTVKLFVSGTNLDAIDLTKIVKASGSPSNIQPATLIGKTGIQLTFDVGDLDPISFTLPVKSQISKDTILTLPLAVRTNDFYIRRKKDEANHTDDLIYSGQVPDDVVKSEIEKRKKRYPPANGSVNVDLNEVEVPPK
jgi:hypothetical protein